MTARQAPARELPKPIDLAKEVGELRCALNRERCLRMTESQAYRAATSFVQEQNRDMRRQLYALAWKAEDADAKLLRDIAELAHPALHDGTEREQLARAVRKQVLKVLGQRNAQVPA